jgi:MFS family permease
MVAALATHLSDSGRATLSVTSAALVTIALGVIIQGRIVDEHVDPPGHWRAHLIAIEILASGIFFIATALGVWACLYFLEADRTPGKEDRALITSALVTTAIAAFLLTIARRALPALWPTSTERKRWRSPALVRTGVACSVGFVVSSVFAVWQLDAPGRLVLVVALAVVLVVLLMMWSGLVEHELATAIRLGRRAWTRVPVRSVEGGPLADAPGLPVAFVPASQHPDDPQLWLSRAGVNRTRQLLREHGAENPLLWQGFRANAILWLRSAPPSDLHSTDAVLIRSNDAGLFRTEPALGLIERADVHAASPPEARPDRTPHDHGIA